MLFQTLNSTDFIYQCSGGKWKITGSTERHEQSSWDQVIEIKDSKLSSKEWHINIVFVKYKYTIIYD